MKVCIFRASDGACDYYRTLLPINTGAIVGHFQKREMWIANLLAKIQFERAKFIDAMQSDIYFLQRVSSELIVNKLRDFAIGCGIDAKIVMDQDDDTFNTSPFSEHYAENGIKELKIIHEGKLIHEWKNGVNMNLKENMKRIDGIKRALSSVDMVTTTNEHLAKIFREYNDNVKVLPNCVDLTHWNKLDLRRKNTDEIRICWQGGHSHWEDLYLIRDSLKQIANKYSNVKIVMVGYMPTSMEKDFRPEQIEYHDWVDNSAHAYRMATLDIDIAIIPLKDSIFNRSKSTIKWVEFSALKIPAIMSYVPPYDSIPEDKSIFVENNNINGWVRGLELLIENKTLRKDLGEMSREYVNQNFNINTQYLQWVNAFKEVRGEHSRQPAIS